MNYAITEKELDYLLELQKIDNQAYTLTQANVQLPEEIKILQKKITIHKEEIKKKKEVIKKIKLHQENNKIAYQTAEEMLVKYEEQKKNIINEKELDAVNEQIEFQSIEIQLLEKKEKNFLEDIKSERIVIKKIEEEIALLKKNIASKDNSMQNVIHENDQEALILQKKRESIIQNIDPIFLSLYKRKNNFEKNQHAVSTVIKNACSTCNYLIASQRLIEIRRKEMLITCESCASILVHTDEAEEEY